MSYTFDTDNLHIVLSSGTTTLNVVDMYSRWKEWVAMGVNSKYLKAFEAIGGDTIDPTAGTYVPAYIYMINGWHVLTQDANHTLAVVGGILLRQGGGDPFQDRAGRTVRINYQQPVQAITVATGGGTAPSALENADALLDRINAVETGLTPRQTLRLIAAILGGKVSGAGTGSEVFRAADDSKDRVTVTVDGSGNRSNVTTDLT